MGYAKKRLPRLVFDFIEGAAGREVASLRNQMRFDEILLQSRVMENVISRNISTTLLNRTYSLPFGIAPMGMCNLAWPDSDRAIADAATEFNIPVCLSTASSSSLEDMFGWTGANCWFQLYVGESADKSLELVKRVESVGYETLVLTVDVPIVSPRLRDLRNGFTVPFHVGIRQFLDLATHPRWLVSTLVHGIPKFANFQNGKDDMEFDRKESRTGADWKFLENLRKLWKGKLIVKGVTSPKDAQKILQLGADAIYVSNHGGRQLDSSPAAIDCLPPIRNALGPDFPILFDSGIRSGEDMVKALAFGANFVMIGRAALFALGANGANGLKALLQKFSEEISAVLAQVGLNDINNISNEILFENTTIPTGSAHKTNINHNLPRFQKLKT